MNLVNILLSININVHNTLYYEFLHVHQAGSIIDSTDTT